MKEQTEIAFIFGTMFTLVLAIFVMLVFLTYLEVKDEYNPSSHTPICDEKYQLFYFVYESTPMQSMSYNQKKKWCPPSVTPLFQPTPTNTVSFNSP